MSENTDANVDFDHFGKQFHNNLNEVKKFIFQIQSKLTQYKSGLFLGELFKNRSLDVSKQHILKNYLNTVSPKPT